MITIGPFCPCNTYTHIQQWELWEKSTMPMATTKKMVQVKFGQIYHRSSISKAFPSCFPRGEKADSVHSSTTPSCLKQQEGFLTFSSLYNSLMQNAQKKGTCRCWKAMQAIPLQELIASSDIPGY